MSSERTFRREPRCEPAPLDAPKKRNKLKSIYSLTSQSSANGSDKGSGSTKTKAGKFAALDARSKSPPPNLAKIEGLYSLEPRRLESDPPRIIDGFKSLPLKLGETPKKPPKDLMKSSLPSIEKTNETPVGPDYYPIWSKGDDCRAPPPLPPRVPHHRPLERSRAMPYSPEPPEVPRQFKPHPESQVSFLLKI